MSIDRKKLKYAAKDAMHDTRPAPYWVSLLLMVITVLLQVLTMSLNGSLSAYRTMLAEFMVHGTATYVEPAAVGGVFGWLLTVALEIMGSVLSVGFVIYALRVWRRQGATAGNLFDGFGVFFRAIWIQLLYSLLIALWGMVYVLPASLLASMTGQAWWLAAALPLLAPMIMAVYSYRLAVYVMLDEPELSCWQCMARSKELMRGHKWELFVLELSFVGWALLAALIPIGGLLLMVWVSVYMEVTMAGYYDRRMTEYAAQNAPPVMPGAGY